MYPHTIHSYQCSISHVTLFRLFLQVLLLLHTVGDEYMGRGLVIHYNMLLSPVLIGIGYVPKSDKIIISHRPFIDWQLVHNIHNCTYIPLAGLTLLVLSPPLKLVPDPPVIIPSLSLSSFWR